MTLRYVPCCVCLQKAQLIALAEANKSATTSRINWKKVAEMLDRREVDCTSCYAHWIRAEQTVHLKKGPFTADEVCNDEMILMTTTR